MACCQLEAVQCGLVEMAAESIAARMVLERICSKVVALLGEHCKVTDHGVLLGV